LETEVDAFTLSLTLGLFILAVLAFFCFKEYPRLRDFLSNCRSTCSRHWEERHLTARCGQGEYLPPTLTNSIGMEFVRIPAGAFLMGTPVDQLDAIAGGDAGYRDWIAHEAPQHRVHISQPFYLGTYPVTQAQWEAVMGNNPSRFKGNPNHPVDQVSWYDVLAFLQTLNALEGSRDYRLPTEAQWEYACRAGTDTPRYHEDVEAIAWYSANSESQTGQTYLVGQKLPNSWGLHDMLGNVWEWCRDGKRNYTADTVTDPIGPLKDTKILSNHTPQMRISVGAMESRMDHWRVLTVVRRGGTPLWLGLVGACLPCGLGLKIVPSFAYDIIGTPVDGFVALL
jgi:formylglycine-generating enzyme required for sulfatase activity